MKQLEFFPAMGGKNDFIHIRSDTELKAALDAAAKRADRKHTDQARYLLRLALGLVKGDEEDIYRKRTRTVLAAVKTGDPSAKQKRGSDHK